MAVSKPLILAEKPSAARAIAEALGGFSRREGYLESPQYLLSWAIGHLVELKDPEEYEPRWKRWSLDSLPMLPPVFGLKVSPKTRGQFDVIARLARQASGLINACDAAREGELIFRYICQVAGVNQPVRRLWVSSLTKEAIRKAFAELKPEVEYDRLYRSALCRAHGDWLVGMNSTRAFTVKFGELLSVGRVQTPTLALLVRREREIAAFVTERYWEVHAQFKAAPRIGYPGKWFGPDGDRLSSAEQAEAIVARVLGQTGLTSSIEEKAVSERPPQLYDLTTLQRDANRRFGLTAAATLKAAQSLYESKLITYPRTDSRYLTRDIIPGLGAVVKAVGSSPEFSEAAGGARLDLLQPGNRRVVDDSKVSDHHAIIPTAEQPGSLAGAEAKVYGLVVRRFLAQFYPEARFLDTEVITSVGALPDRFRSRGRRVVDPGWRAVEPEPPKAKGDQSEVLATLPHLKQGQSVATDSVEAREKQTQPPKRFTEASLLSAMEFAGKVMDDEALKDAMKGRGLGTPATRASIIERLKKVGYILPEKKALVPTAKGVRLITLAETAGAQVLLSAELTGEWEKRIVDIQAGTYESEQFMTEVRQLAAQVVELTRRAPAPPPERATEGARPRASRSSSKATRATAPDASEETISPLGGKCPRCGRAVVRGSRDWACVNQDCAIRIPSWLCGKVIDQSLADALLTKSRTPLITGFKSQRTGTTFSAYLVLREGRVEFEFPVNRAKKGTKSEKTGAVKREAAKTSRSRKAKPAEGDRVAVPFSTSSKGRRPAQRAKPAGDMG